MNFKVFSRLILLIGFMVTAQKKEAVLFTIDNEPVYTTDFIKVYNKNKNLIDDSSKNGVAGYLDLYVNYKLKVKEAIELKLDTTQKFRNELKEYRINLIQPYLKDKDVSDKLVQEAYDRILKEVDVSHILIFLKPNASEKDTLEAYNKLLEARDLVIKGEKFENIAVTYSQDPTVQDNGGRIGYFTGLQMVYPFENAAFSTKINEVSMPFRTKFGFHILKVHNIRNSKGEVEVAHIMIKGDSLTAKKRIDSIYTIVKMDVNKFEDLAKNISDDRASAANGGKLEKFGTGRMVQKFADESFKLKEIGEISEPFKTAFGWHIAKLIKKFPIESFDVIKAKLSEQVNNDERSNLIGESVLKKLFKDYKIVVNNQSLKQFESDHWQQHPEEFKNELLTVENKSINQEDFIDFLNSTRSQDVANTFKNFKEKVVLDYYKDNIENLNPEFAAMFTEFKEGLLLFDLLEKKVWEQSKDSLQLTNYYVEHKSSVYNNKDLNEIKGVVISDFQNYLEKKWINELYLKYNVVFNKKEKRKVLKLKP